MMKNISLYQYNRFIRKNKDTYFYFDNYFKTIYPLKLTYTYII